MNNNKGTFPFSKMGQPDERKTERVKSNLVGSIDPKLQAAVSHAKIETVPVPPTAESKSRGRPRKNSKKHADGRPMSKPVYFDVEVYDELTRRHLEEGLNISFFVNKLVKEKLNIK